MSERNSTVKAMNYLVTGAAGFIGSFLARALIARGDDVVGIDNFHPYYPRQAKEFNVDLTSLWSGQRPSFHKEEDLSPVYEAMCKWHETPVKPGRFIFYEGDICDENFLQKVFFQHKFDGILHLAAMAGVPLSQKEPQLYATVNVGGTINLLQQAKKNNVPRFLFASSSSVYGNSGADRVDEDADVTRPKSVYGATKVAGELQCYVANVTSPMSVNIVRIFGPVYGPLQRPYGMFQQRAINYLHNKIPLTIYGRYGLKTAKDATYIDDEVRGLLLAFDEIGKPGKFNVYNISSGVAHPLSRWIGIIEQAAGNGSLQVTVAASDESDAISRADITKARQELAFTPEFSPEEGIRRQVEIFKLMPEWYRGMEV